MRRAADALTASEGIASSNSGRYKESEIHLKSQYAGGSV